MGERRLCTAEVTSSILVRSTTDLQVNRVLRAFPETPKRPFATILQPKSATQIRASGWDEAGLVGPCWDGGELSWPVDGLG
jgi:hypothetical protein